MQGEWPYTRSTSKVSSTQSPNSISHLQSHAVSAKPFPKVYILVISGTFHRNFQDKTKYTNSSVSRKLLQFSELSTFQLNTTRTLMQCFANNTPNRPLTEELSTVADILTTNSSKPFFQNTIFPTEFILMYF